MNLCVAILHLFIAGATAFGIIPNSVRLSTIKLFQDAQRDKSIVNNQNIVQCNIGEILYYVQRDVLTKYPECCITQLLSEDETLEDTIFATNRDGMLFRYIYDYMCYGILPRDENGASLLPTDLLSKLEIEAEFYKLPGLLQECQTLQSEDLFRKQFNIYESFKHQMESVNSNNIAIYNLFDEDDYERLQKEKEHPLLPILNGLGTVPAWIMGTIPQELNTNVYKTTTIKQVNVTEILHDAKPSPFGQGNQTMFDLAVRDSVEIPASQLGDLSEIIDALNITAMAPHRQLVLKPYKLVIYKVGGHFCSHRDTVRDENHIGTLVLILHSNYTGGELEITHYGQSVSVSGGGNWVAMYGDTLHSILPVTSGTRVSLIFDILSLPTMSDSTTNTESEASASTEQTIESNRIEEICVAIDKEFKEYDTVSISLNHLYPACQANADFLKGEDRALYHALKGKYKIGTTPIFMNHEMLGYAEFLFFDQFRFSAVSTIQQYDNDLIKKNEKNVLFVPKEFDETICLRYIDYFEYTGNEPQYGVATYLVTALVLRKRDSM